MLPVLTASLLCCCCCFHLQGTTSKAKLQQVKALNDKLKDSNLNTELSETALIYEQDTTNVLSSKLAKAQKAQKSAEHKVKVLLHALKNKTDVNAQLELLLGQRGAQVAFYLRLLRVVVPNVLDHVSAPPMLAVC